MTNNDHVVIFDTTLRDGEQAPGASMILEEKVRVARALEALGVDVIEAGFPVASAGDFEAVQTIARNVRDVIVCGLSRAIQADIDRTAEAIRPAVRGRIHTFLATSALHMRYKLRKDEKQVLALIDESVRYARQHTDDVEWSAEDATRSDHDFLCRCVETAIKAGATTINIPDTVGYTTPAEYAVLIEMLRQRVPNIDRAVLSTHCHDDLGLAVANSLAGVLAGARQVECTINGIGERAGNASLEEIVMSLRTRPDVYRGLDTRVNGPLLTRTSRLVSSVTGFPVPPNKAIVGANAFAHESGIHQQGVRQNRETYEIMTPQSVGAERSTMVLGKHSGRDAFTTRVRELGYTVTDDALQDAFARFKQLADSKKHVGDDDIMGLLDEAMAHAHDRIRLVRAVVRSGTGRAHANIALTLDGEELHVRGFGDGPLDAGFRCVRRALKARIPKTVALRDFHVTSVTPGTDAQGEVRLMVQVGGIQFSGASTHMDSVLAALTAYVRALGKALTYLETGRGNTPFPGSRPIL
ncbi:MAG: 2-isopropylmalate synthase [Candidatus Pacebacteria bacterium]|nr:2-isopropylmalate synthase [Candidatus Paceibacterota bacterium]